MIDLSPTHVPSRRVLRTTLLLVSMLATLAGTATTAQAAPLPAPLPVVDMVALDVAAQVEPRAGNQLTLGDDASTTLVQRALTAKGFPVTADGRYGQTTTAAYLKFQRSLGYRSIDANGMPGPASLARLGRGRFTVAGVVQVGSRSDTFGGKRVSNRGRAMLTAADATLPWALRLSQGSYCGINKPPCAAASAGTHDGGGAFDLSVRGLSTTQRWRTVRALRAVGFAAWLRVPSQCGGCWNSHIHAIAIADTDLWQRNGRFDNRDQVAAYFTGRNGLSGHALDNTPLKYRVPFTVWERYVAP